MKHKLFSIPLMGMALTSVGCDNSDAITNTWQTDTAFSRANPFSGQNIDIGGGVICNVDVVFGDMIIDAELVGSLTYDLTFSNCSDPARDNTYNYLYNVSAEIIEPNATYKIVLTDSVISDFTTTLDCQLVNANLNCSDNGGQDWAFNAAQ
jgi:hypothetical protein